MSLTAFLDLDNTCIETNEYYLRANDKNATYIQQTLSLPIDLQDIKEKNIEIDLVNVEKWGFAPQRVVTSWIETYEFYCQEVGIEPQAYDKEILSKNANEIFESNIPAFPNTHDTLEYLKNKGYTLHLLTLGDVTIQNKRIDDANLRHYFDDIHIVPKKDKDTLEKILKDTKQDPRTSVMIGDSLKGDIQPALSLNMKAIHIQTETWAFDRADVDKNDPNYIVIDHLGDLTKIL